MTGKVPNRNILGILNKNVNIFNSLRVDKSVGKVSVKCLLSVLKESVRCKL